MLTLSRLRTLNLARGGEKRSNGCAATATISASSGDPAATDTQQKISKPSRAANGKQREQQLQASDASAAVRRRLNSLASPHSLAYYSFKRTCNDTAGAAAAVEAGIGARVKPCSREGQRQLRSGNHPLRNCLACILQGHQVAAKNLQEARIANQIGCQRLSFTFSPSLGVAARTLQAYTSDGETSPQTRQVR